ncbi:hypothetical protein HYW17_01095 [Candidatus Uhrbacteria bacterium]|nr:hypothetical protein [Candidatus Uhrbacteria bacterium]
MSLFYRALLSVAVLVAGLAVIMLIVVAPTIASMRVLAQAIDEERARIEKTVSGALGLRHTGGDVQKVKEALPRLMELFIKPGREIELFTLLEEKSRRSGLSEKLRLGEPQAGKHALLELPIEIEVKGNLTSTLNFIGELESAPLLLPLSELEFRLNPAGEERKNELTSIFRGAAYVHQ